MKTKTESIKTQEWVSVGSSLWRDGESLARLLNTMNVYEDAAAVLRESKVGDVIKTGVSAYERRN